MLKRVVLAGLLLAGVLANDVRAEAPSSLVQRTYPVADLIVGHDDYLVPPMSSELLGPPERRPAARESSENELMKLIIHAIAPTSWQARGGAGTIDYFPLGMALVIQQTPEIHERIAELLNGMRELSNLEVGIETRLLSLSDETFERVCGQLGIQPQEADLDRASPDAAVPSATRVVLDDCQVFQLMELVQEDNRCEVMLAPKLTVFDGQTASLQVVDYQFFVTNVQVVQHGGSVVFVPQQQPVAVGAQIQVKPVVSADIRSVRLDLKLHCTDVAATVPLLPIQTFITPLVEGGGHGQPVPFTQFVQQPKIRHWNLDESVQLPDKQTVLLTGWKRSRQAPSELGGLLADLLADLLGPSFDDLRHREETEHLMLLVTPRISVAEEEAWQGTGVGCLPTRDTDVPDLFGEMYAGELPATVFRADDEIFMLHDRMAEASRRGQLLKVQQLTYWAMMLDPWCLFRLPSEGRVRFWPPLVDSAPR